MVRFLLEHVLRVLSINSNSLVSSKIPVYRKPGHQSLSLFGSPKEITRNQKGYYTKEVKKWVASSRSSLNQVE